MTPALRFLSAAITTASPDEASGSLFIAGVFLNGGKPRLTPVSYTHLTLPTICSV